jgi:hypothetical protein
MTNYNVGDEIPVIVGSRTFITIIDVNGTQRFKENTVINAFVNASQEAYSRFTATRTGPMPYTLNDLSVEYYEGKHTLDDMLTFYTSIGYSVTGLSDLSYFEELDIRNPIWESDHYNSLSSKAYTELMELIGVPYKSSSDEPSRFLFDAITSGKWVVKEGNITNGTDTIDRVICLFLEKKEIEPWDIEVKDSTSDELKGFIKHLS